MSTPIEAVSLHAIPDLLPEAGFACVYGSYGTQQFDEESDLDLAVYMGRPLAPEEFLALSAQVEAVVHLPVDILDLFCADPIVSHQVLRTGRVLFARRPGELYRFQMKALSAYLDEKLDRRVIEEAMLAGV